MSTRLTSFFLSADDRAMLLRIMKEEGLRMGETLRYLIKCRYNNPVPSASRQDMKKNKPKVGAKL